MICFAPYTKLLRPKIAFQKLGVGLGRKWIELSLWCTPCAQLLWNSTPGLAPQIQPVKIEWTIQTPLDKTWTMKELFKDFQGLNTYAETITPKWLFPLTQNIPYSSGRVPSTFWHFNLNKTVLSLWRSDPASFFGCTCRDEWDPPDSKIPSFRNRGLDSKPQTPENKR